MRMNALGRISQAWRSLTERAADFAFAVDCPLCGQVDPLQFAGAGELRTVYCRACCDLMAPEIRTSCRRCGAEVGDYSEVSRGCVHCRGRQLKFDSVVCLGMYRSHLKKALLSAKWTWSSVNMESLAELCWQRQSERLQQLQIDRVIPLPQHWSQRVTRHFNPAWIVAERLSRHLRVPCDVHILRRNRRTRPQKRVAVTMRFENQQNAFRLRDAFIVRGQRLLLVDDVLTTGATCSEAARLLKLAGAAACHVAVIGRVLDHSA